MKAGVISGSIGGVGNLGPVLCDFDPLQVLEKYPSGWEGVLDDIVAQLKPTPLANVVYIARQTPTISFR